MTLATRGRLLLATLAFAVGASLAPNLGATEARTAPISSGSAVYVSVGDGIQWGCCGDSARSADALFARYLSDQLGRQVEWVSIARGDGWVTTDTFLHGSAGRQSQMQRLADALAAYGREGRPVVAITLSVGGNNLVDMGNACHMPPCGDLYQKALAAMTPQLDAIYQGINASKDPSTPLLVLTYYNASDCGQPGVASSPAELAVRGWDATIEASVKRAGAFLVDGYTPFKARACDLVAGLDLNYQGHQVLAAQYERAYASLPRTNVDPFRKSATSMRVIAAFLAGAFATLVALTWFGYRRSKPA